MQVSRGGETRTHTLHGLNVVSLPIGVRPFVLDAERRRPQIKPRGDLARDPRADPAGLKPATSRFVARCSVRLSYRSWGGDGDQTRIRGRPTGLEPVLTRATTGRSFQLSYSLHALLAASSRIHGKTVRSLKEFRREIHVEPAVDPERIELPHAGFHPAALPILSYRSKQEATRASGWRRRGSNPRPPACDAGALPT